MSIDPRQAVAGAVVVAGLAAAVWAVAANSDSNPDPIAASAVADGNDPDPVASPSPTPMPQPIERLGPVPELVEISQWLNTNATSLDEVRGEVTIVQFWTFGCANCKNTLPHLKAIYEQHQADGLEILGVHAHEFDFEADPDNIAAAVVDLGVNWPVAIDATKKNFREWQPGTTSYWPRTYVIDQNGQIRFDHIGEGAYDELASTVARLLADGPNAT